MANSLLLKDADNEQIKLCDNVELIFGSGTGATRESVGDFTMVWDGTDFDVVPTTDDSVWKFGDGTTSWDIWIYGNTANDNIIFDASANTLNLDGIDLQLEDSDILSFGDADDVTITWDGSNLVINTASADTGDIQFGADGAGVDVQLFGDTSGYDVLWDQSADSLIFNDNAKLVLGTGSDVTAAWDGTDLDITAAADDSIIKFGNGTNSFDVWVYGNTASDYLLWDASANTLQPAGGGIIKPYIAITDPGDTGAIPITVSGYCPLVTAGAETRTLAAPTYIGQRLLLYMKTDGGNCTVTCATTVNETGNNTLTFDNTGEAIELVAVEEGANIRWRAGLNDGVGLTTV
ncbi:MAG: hypothetical protein ACE5HE_14340 [Phycisphaerae bacterium]